MDASVRLLSHVAIVTVSDRASQGIYEDKGGPAVLEWLTHNLPHPVTEIRRIVPDDQTHIQAVLCELADLTPCRLIITTGGTGPAVRDVTPEATEAVCDKLLPGFGERMRMVSIAEVPTAILSRQLAGIRKRSLIINLPGNPGAIAVCLQAVFPALKHCLELIDAPD